MSVFSMLSVPPYHFKGGNDYVVAWGLYKFGPVKNISKDVIDSRIFYVTSAGKKDYHYKLVRRLSESLVKGLKHPECGTLSFYGFENYFKKRLNLNHIEVVVSDLNDPKDVSAHVTDAVSQNPADIPLIVLPEHPKELSANHYYYTKTMLFLKGIFITQVVLYETLIEVKKLCSSLLPISLQIFTKLGGIPYTIAKPIGGKGYKTLLIGVGLSKLQSNNDLEQYMGVVSVFASDGTFKYIDYSLTEVNRDRLAKSLEQSIRSAIGKLRREGMLAPDENLWIIVHYSGKEMSGEEERAIVKTCKELSQEMSTLLEPSIIKITDNNIYRVFNTQYKYYPVIGSYVELVPMKLYILNTLGYDVSKKGPLRKEMPNSLLISIKKAQSSLIQELLYSVLAMARVNFSAAQLMYLRPATISYPRKATKLLSRSIHIARHLDGSLSLELIERDKLWFI